MAVIEKAVLALGSLTLDDDTSIYYQHYRSVGSDSCVVLMHSLALDHRFWHLVAPSLAESASVICIDIRGHGRSSKPAGPYSIELFANDVKQLVHYLGYERIIIGGASLGGCIALQFALDYPELTAGLALIDTTSWYGPSAINDWQSRAQKARTEGFASMVQFQTTRWFGDGFREDHLQEVQQCIDTFIDNNIDSYEATCLAMGAFNVSERLNSITVPTAIVVGSEDYAAPVAMSEHMHKFIVGSSLQIIPGARHLTPLETPDVIIRTLQDLLRTVRTK